MQDTTDPSQSPTADVDAFVANLPLLHTWDHGKTWNSGGFEQKQFDSLRAFFDRHLLDQRRIIETGCCNSTIFFLLTSPTSVVSIDPEESIYCRVLDYCNKNRISSDRHEMHINHSELVLPKIAEVRKRQFDFALIDGNHGWPTVFVDFWYCNMLVRKGGFVMLDDVQLHSVKELARFLAEEPSFAIVLDLGKALVFEKNTDEIMTREWLEQPYIARLSDEYQKWRNPNSLFDE